MIGAPYNFEPVLSDQEFQKIGHLSLKWSHLEHFVGNCLKVMLRLTDEEARIIVFPLGIEQRLTRMTDLAKLGGITARSQFLLDEFRALFRGIQYVRNNVVHAVVETGSTQGGTDFYLHSKDRSLAKDQVFSIEEITNYAAHVVLALRFSLGFRDGSTLDYALPYRPEIPKFLQSMIQWPEDQGTVARQHRQRSSPG